MERPFVDKRPIGPFNQLLSEDKNIPGLNFNFRFTSKTNAGEALSIVQKAKPTPIDVIDYAVTPRNTIGAEGRELPSGDDDVGTQIVALAKPGRFGTGVELIEAWGEGVEKQLQDKDIEFSYSIDIRC